MAVPAEVPELGIRHHRRRPIQPLQRDDPAPSAPNLPPDRGNDTVFNQFEVLDCSSPPNRVYTLNLPAPGGHVFAELKPGSPHSPDGARGDLENRSGSEIVVRRADDVQDPSVKNDVELQIYEDTPSTPGLWDIGYNWPFCAVDPSMFSAASPARPDIVLTAVPGTPPTFTGRLMTTPAIPPGRTCLVTANYPYVEDPSVIPPVVTQCQGEIDVEVGGCDYQNKEFELEISNHGIGDPHWLPGQGIVQADPRITWVTTDDSGYATVHLAVGDKTPTGTTLEIIARAKPDASGNYAWTCPRNTQDTFVVDNKCVNFRAYYRPRSASWTCRTPAATARRC